MKRMFGVLCDRSSTKSSVIIRGKVLSASGDVYGRTASEVAYIYARSAIIDAGAVCGFANRCHRLSETHKG